LPLLLLAEPLPPVEPLVFVLPPDAVPPVPPAPPLPLSALPPAPPPPPVRDTDPAASEPVVVEETPPDVPTEYATVVDQSPNATALVMVE
jgi:hypothetical protein